jgi:hypothetical protein
MAKRVPEDAVSWLEKQDVADIGDVGGRVGSRCST